jgi:hypothetical protein
MWNHLETRLIWFTIRMVRLDGEMVASVLMAYRASTTTLDFPGW